MSKEIKSYEVFTDEFSTVIQAADIVTAIEIFDMSHKGIITCIRISDHLPHPSIAGQKLWMERSMSELPPPDEGMSAFSIDVPLIYNDGSIKLGYYHYEAKEWYWFDYTGEGIKVLESVKWLSMSSEPLPLENECRYSKEDINWAMGRLGYSVEARKELLDDIIASNKH